MLEIDKKKNQTNIIKKNRMETIKDASKSSFLAE